MSIARYLVRGFQGLRAEVGGAPAPWDDFWYGPIGMPSASGMRITADTVKRLSTVIACVSAKARALGVLPCMIFTDMAGGGKRVVREHPYFNLLHSRPNYLQTAFEFYQMMQGHVELRGNAYAEICANARGVIGELIPMHPDHVKIEVLSTGRLRYVYNDPLSKTTRTLLQDEVLHIRDWADQRAIGQSRISMGMDVYGVALAQQDFRGKYFKNDASTGVIITGTNFENKQAEEQYVQAFEEASTGEKRHRLKMLPPGVDIKTLGVKPSDMQLLEECKSSAVEICTMHNVLPHLIGVDTGKSATYASVEQFNLMHAQQCVLPMAVMWEQALQRDVIDDDRFYCKFSLSVFLRGDFATRTQGYAVAIEHGWMSDDDVRELEDLNPLPNGLGKQYFRPMNWTTLDAKPTPATGGAGNSDPEDSPQDDQDEDQDEQSVHGDGSAQGARASHLLLLAHDAAARCVRREVGALRKLVDSGADEGAVVVFYNEHYRFLCGAMRLRPNAALEAKRLMDERSAALQQYLSRGDEDGARALIDRIAVTEADKLAALAVKGVI